MVDYKERCSYLEKELKDLQGAYDIAMGEINNLRCKLGYNREGLICPSSQKTSSQHVKSEETESDLTKV